MEGVSEIISLLHLLISACDEDTTIVDEMALQISHFFFLALLFNLLAHMWEGPDK
jgi:hypothetical protein